MKNAKLFFVIILILILNMILVIDVTSKNTKLRNLKIANSPKIQQNIPKSSFEVYKVFDSKYLENIQSINLSNENLIISMSITKNLRTDDMVRDMESVMGKQAKFTHINDDKQLVLEFR